MFMNSVTFDETASYFENIVFDEFWLYRVKVSIWYYSIWVIIYSYNLFYCSKCIIVCILHQIFLFYFRMDDRQIEDYLNRLSDSGDDDFTSQQKDVDLSDVEDHVELDEMVPTDSEMFRRSWPNRGYVKDTKCQLWRDA